MRLIVGLGNPGEKYSQTRHNVGFQVLDELSKKLGLDWQFQKKFKSLVGKTQDLVLIKPQTYMNESGQAVRAVWDYFQFGQDFESLIVVHDDLDLELGSYKVQLGTGPRDHHGLNSIYQHLKTHQFWHVRIGVDSRLGNRDIPADQYVLSGFSSQEKTVLDETILQVVTRLRAENI